MVDFVRSVSLHIWRIEWSDCFWPLWFSKPTISSTVITFLQYVYASVCWFHVFGWCCMSTKSLLITFSLFPCCSLFSKILPVFSENYFLKWYKFLIRAFTPLLNGTLPPVYRQCMKNYYLRQYSLLLFTNIRNVCSTYHNLIFVKKLVKIVLEDNFLHMYYNDFSDFWKSMFHMVVQQHS